MTSHRTLIFNLLTAAVLLPAAISPSSAQIPLQITQGGQDTVHTKSIYVVGVTDPKAVAAVNGNQVKVYKTGAFGAQVQLREGDNSVCIDLLRGGLSLRKEWNVFYSAPGPVAAAPSDPKDVYIEKLFYVVTREGAYLTYSDAADRLGGAKMGFLDEGIVLKVVGEEKELYRVQLSDSRFAFIEKQYVSPTDGMTSRVNVGNWEVSNHGYSDEVRIALGSKLPYSSSIESDPTVINVDIYSALNNSNWITQYPELGMIEYVDVQQVESDVVRAVIKLKEKYSWGYSIHYENGSLVISVKHTPENLTLKGLKIGLDAGHGGEALGAVSTTGLQEKDVNLSIVFQVKNLLEAKGSQVFLSRSDDSDISIAQRKKFFLDNGIDLLVSIHNNSGGSPLKSMGTSAYYKYIVNRDLAKCLFDRMRELGVPSYGLTGNFNFGLNSPTEYPNALVECLFLSSLPDEELLADPTYHRTIATKIVAGLEDYLKIVDSSLSRNSQKKKK